MKYEAKRSQFMKLGMIYKTNIFRGDFHFDPDEIRALIIAQEFLCKYFHPITGEENDLGAFCFSTITHQFTNEKFLLVSLSPNTFLSELKPTLDTVITFHFNNLPLSAVIIIHIWHSGISLGA